MERIAAVPENNGALIHLYDMLLAIKEKVCRIGRLVILWTVSIARFFKIMISITVNDIYFLFEKDAKLSSDRPVEIAFFFSILFRRFIDTGIFVELSRERPNTFNRYSVYQNADGNQSFLMWFTWALQIFYLTVAAPPASFLGYSYMVVSIISLFVPFVLTYENLMELYGEAPAANVPARRQKPARVPLVWKSRFRELRLLHAGETLECLICREVYKFGDETCRLPTCKHRYHDACLKEWCNVRNVYPLCEVRIPCVNKDAFARSKKQ